MTIIILTPQQIRVLIHYVCFTDDFPESCNGAIQDMTMWGLLEETGAGAFVRFKATDRAKVHLDALCAVPLPEQQWVSPGRKE